MKQKWLRSLEPKSPADWASRVGLISSVVTISSLFVIVAKTPDGSARVYAITLSLITAMAILQAALYSYRKPHRYAQVMEHVHYVNHTIRDAISRLLHADGTLGRKEAELLLRSTVTEVVDSLHNALGLVSGLSCYVCIKEIVYDYKDPNSIAVKTVIRDKYSHTSRRDQNDKSHVPHIRDNTAFSELWEDRSRNAFICNDLPSRWKKGDYQNTSFAIYGQPRKRFWGTVKWTLPYCSTIVVPIRFLPSGSERGQISLEELGESYYGFLCVDARQREIFRGHEMLMLMGAVADNLYTLFYIFNNFHDQTVSEGE